MAEWSNASDCKSDIPAMDREGSNPSAHSIFFSRIITMEFFILARNGQRYTRAEWSAIDSEMQDELLKKYGPLYTESAYRRHVGKGKLPKKPVDTSHIFIKR